MVVSRTRPPAEAETAESGLAWIVLEDGSGDAGPGERDHVRVHYTGWTTDGRMFDTTANKAEPMAFRVDQVIAGWTEGLQMMVEGEKRRFWIPAELAYEGVEGRPQGMLVFDVELVEIKGDG